MNHVTSATIKLFLPWGGPSETSRNIDLAKPVLDEWIEVARFRAGADLYAEMLAELGEA